MFYNSLNKDSHNRIENIVTGFKNFPMYAAYSIESYCYDVRSGAYAIEVTKNGQPLNLFLFYPGPDGEIGSIAIYGSALQGHYNAIKSSMTIFGMPVKSVDMDYSGISDFVDVFLEKY